MNNDHPIIQKFREEFFIISDHGELLQYEGDLRKQLEQFLLEVDKQAREEERNKKLNAKSLEAASNKLKRLRLTDVYGEKDIPQETVKSVLKRGLGGMYSDEAITYILKFGIKYYLSDLQHQERKEENGD